MAISELTAFYEKSEMVNVVIETPRGNPFKLKYESSHDVFRAHKPIPLGLVFPFDFGFVPSTLAADGDPLDALVLSSYPMPSACVVLGDILSALEAEQIEDGKKERNDRIIVAPMDSVSRTRMQPEITLNEELQNAICDFFVKYNELQGKTFKPITFAGPEKAIRLTREAMESAKHHRKG